MSFPGTKLESENLTWHHNFLRYMAIHVCHMFEDETLVKYMYFETIIVHK